MLVFPRPPIQTQTHTHTHTHTEQQQRGGWWVSGDVDASPLVSKWRSLPHEAARGTAPHSVINALRGEVCVFSCVLHGNYGQIN